MDLITLWNTSLQCHRRKIVAVFLLYNLYKWYHIILLSRFDIWPISYPNIADSGAPVAQQQSSGLHF